MVDFYIMFMWHAITFLISAEISFDFEMKKKEKKKNCLVQEEKKENKVFETRPLGIELVSVILNGLTIVLPSRLL